MDGPLQFFSDPSMKLIITMLGISAIAWMDRKLRQTDAVASRDRVALCQRVLASYK